MKDDLRITETSGPRFDLAMERLREGHSFVFGRVVFCFRSDCCLECAVQSSWQVENLTDDRARHDLAHAIDVFSHIKASSNDFAALVAEEPAVYSVIEDYGMGCVELCRIEGDQLRWTKGIGRS